MKTLHCPRCRHLRRDTRTPWFGDRLLFDVLACLLPGLLLIGLLFL